MFIDVVLAAAAASPSLAFQARDHLASIGLGVWHGRKYMRTAPAPHHLRRSGTRHCKDGGMGGLNRRSACHVTLFSSTARPAHMASSCPTFRAAHPAAGASMLRCAMQSMPCVCGAEDARADGNSLPRPRSLEALRRDPHVAP